MSELHCMKEQIPDVRSSVDIDKAAVGSIISYTSETRPDKLKARRLVEATEMNILCKIVGKLLH